MTARHLAVGTVLAGALIGGGIVGAAAIGSAIADHANVEQPRFRATARCEDGTWSWTKNPDAAGACVAHGGVAFASY